MAITIDPVTGEPTGIISREEFGESFARKEVKFSEAMKAHMTSLFMAYQKEQKAAEEAMNAIKERVVESAKQFDSFVSYARMEHGIPNGESWKLNSDLSGMKKEPPPEPRPKVVAINGPWSNPIQHATAPEDDGA